MLDIVKDLVRAGDVDGVRSRRGGICFDNLGHFRLVEVFIVGLVLVVGVDVFGGDAALDLQH